MYACMYVCMRRASAAVAGVCPCATCPHAHTPIRPYAHTPIRPYAHMPICPNAHMPICPYAYMPIRPYALHAVHAWAGGQPRAVEGIPYVHTCIHTYIHAYLHTYMHGQVANREQSKASQQWPSHAQISLRLCMRIVGLSSELTAKCTRS